MVHGLRRRACNAPHAPEVGVRALCQLVHALLQRAARPVCVAAVTTRAHTASTHSTSVARQPTRGARPQHATTQPARKRTDGEVDVLQQHPAAVLVRVLQRVHRNRLLALAQAHAHVAPGVRREAQLDTQRLDGRGLHQCGGQGCARPRVCGPNPVRAPAATQAQV
jgi:hypothetical protein